MDDKKDMQSDRSQELFPKDLLRIEERPSFYSLAVQKAEKAGTALYIITNHINHGESIKKEIRNEATALVLNTISLEGPDPADDFLFRSLDTSITTILSLLKIGSTINLITEANFLILERELTKLKSFFAFGQKFYVGKTFDAVLKGMYGESQESLGDGSDKRHLEPVQDKRQPEPLPPEPKKIFQQKTAPVVKKIEPKVVPKILQKESGSRRDQIVSIVKDKGEVSIKDISESFSDCSEKTIQREINALIEEGVLSKTGDRRWSRYSMK